MYDTDVSFDLTPGFVVGIIDGEKEYFLTFGSSADKQSDTLSTQSIFELGSVTKSITVALAKILAQKNLISLDNKINDFVDAEYRNPRLNFSFEDLIYYNTDFPIRPQGFGLKEIELNNPYKYYSKKDLLEYYRNYVPTESEYNFDYSHVNFALLEICIENATGSDFEDLLFLHLLDPLGMEATFINFLERKTNIVASGKERNGLSSTPWEFASFGASEGMKSNVHDLAKFINAFLHKNEHQPYFESFFETEKLGYHDKLKTTDGWHKLEINKKNSVLINTGRTSGHSSFLAFNTNTNTGVIILSNSSIGTKDLGLLILRMVNDNWKRKS